MITAFLLSLALAGGCNKDGGGTADPGSVDTNIVVGTLPKDRIVKITRKYSWGDESVFQIAYNPNGTVAAVTATGVDSFARVFAHTPRLTVATIYKEGHADYNLVDSFFYDASGRLSEYRYTTWRRQGPPQRGQSRTVYNYDGAGRLYRSEFIVDVPSLCDTATYDWQGGDLMRTRSTSINAIEYSYEYYTDKPCVAGDFLYLQQLMKTGRFSAPNAHACKLRDWSTGYTETFSHDYSGDRIVKVTRGNNFQPYVETYEYAP